MDVRPKKLPLIEAARLRARHVPADGHRPGLAFEVAVGEDVPRELYSDEQRLQQILRNLLSNAVKFTAAGGVELRVEPRRRTEHVPRADRGDVVAFREGHRHRHRAARNSGDLRGVPAVRRHDQPQVRRHRPRPVHQPGDRAAARRRRIDAESEPGRAACSRSTFPPGTPAGRPAPVGAAGRRGGRAGRRDPGRRVRKVRAAGAPGRGRRLPARGGGPAEQRAPGGERAGDEEPALTGMLQEPPADYLDTVLSGRRVLIVDDDVRNVFALTSVLRGTGWRSCTPRTARRGSTPCTATRMWRSC